MNLHEYDLFVCVYKMGLREGCLFLFAGRAEHSAPLVLYSFASESKMRNEEGVSREQR